MRNGMTIVKSFINNAEAQLALSQLEAMGIKGFVEVDNCGGMRPHMDMSGGVHLLVGDDELEQATDPQLEVSGREPEALALLVLDGDASFVSVSLFRQIFGDRVVKSLQLLVDLVLVVLHLVGEIRKLGELVLGNDLALFEDLEQPVTDLLLTRHHRTGRE